MKDDIDLINRDPNEINDHVKVFFEDVLGEPDGIRSHDCVWQNSYSCFNCCKGCCYKLMTVFCAIPCAVCWGWDFACNIFYHVWCITPFLKCYMIWCGCCQKVYGTWIQCCAQPWYEAHSYILSNIRVTQTKA